MAARRLKWILPNRSPAMHRVSVIDSHTGGEPTRVVVAGGPDLGGGPLAERRDRFRTRLRRASARPW